MSSSTLVILTIIISLSFGQYQDCGYHFPNASVTFDLSPLTLTATSNKSHYGVPSGNYLYAFNLCEDVIDPGTTIDPNCAFGNNYQFEDANGNLHPRDGTTGSLAFQNGNGQCYRLAASTNETYYNISKDAITYKLFDDADPALGITIHYNYGDYCDGIGNRELDITFICDPDTENIPDSGIQFQKSRSVQTV